MSKDWERHSLCCEQLWETGECDCEARDVMRVTAGLPKRAPHTLSERYTEIWGLRFEGGEERTYNLLPEVKALEAELERFREFARTTHKARNTLNAVDKLNQGYERAGLSSALVVNNKYGKHSAFGYMGRE